MDKNFKYIKTNSNSIIFNKKLFFITLTFIILIIINIRPNRKFFVNLLERKSKEHPIINNFTLFNATNNPFLSIILNFSIPKINNEQHVLLNFISSLNEQSFRNIQILFSYNYLSSDLFEEEMKKYLMKSKNIELYKCRDKVWKNNFIDLFEKIKGKFFIVFDELIKLEKDDIFNLYNKIKGSIYNIFDFNFHTNLTYYLIRTKTVKNFIDSEGDFENYQDIINFLIKTSNHHINYIPIAYCPNNFYASLTYTSMISVLSSKMFYSYILFYLIISEDFSNTNIELIDSLYEQFDYFNITYIKMDNRYEKAYTRRYLSKSAFYRLSLGELLPNLNKVIYLDSDTIVLKDLSNLYELNFMGKIFLASMLTFNKGYLNFTINSGVLLLNLKKMRKMKIEKYVLTLLNNNFTDPNFHDQAIINLYYKKYIGFFSPEFNRFKTFKNYLENYYKDIKGFYDYDTLYFFLKFPSILHYPAHPDLKTYNDEDWYYFARKSKYFQKRSHNYSDIFNFSL